jgi:L-rhamnose 1-dehydrogenase
MRLRDKVALVTGGSRGIGRAISLALAREGARLAVNYASRADAEAGHDDAAEAVRREIEAMGGQSILLDADLADERQARQVIRDTCARYGFLDILVCNAGICPMHDFLDMPIELYDRVHAVNLRSHFVCCQEAARSMVNRRCGGRIIAITSISALRAGPQQTHYCPTKAGLHSLMQCLAAVLGPHGITCNSVAPGEVQTDLTTHLPGHAATWEHLSKTLPLGRIAQPDDVAAVVAFLATREAAYLTGQHICVDGGASVLEP